MRKTKTSIQPQYPPSKLLIKNQKLKAQLKQSKLIILSISKTADERAERNNRQMHENAESGRQISRLKSALKSAYLGAQDLEQQVKDLMTERNSLRAVIAALGTIKKDTMFNEYQYIEIRERVERVASGIHERVNCETIAAPKTDKIINTEETKSNQFSPIKQK